MEGGSGHSEKDLNINSEIKSATMISQQILCRICALEEIDPKCHGWKRISDRCFQTSETIEFIMRKCFPKELMTQLPSDVFMQYICPSCFSNLQIFKDFIDKMIRGQKRLEELFKLGSNYLKLKASQVDSAEVNVDDNYAKPRKRGRPRKDAQKSKPESASISPSFVEPREKRTVRPPMRYGNQIIDSVDSIQLSQEPIDDCVQNEENVNDVIMNNQSEHCDSVSVPEVFMEVTVEKKDDDQSASSIMYEGTDTNKSDKPSNLKSFYTSNNEDDDDVTPNENEVNNQNDNGDANFRYGSRKRGNRIKRGRPKKRKLKDFKCDRCEKVYTAYASLVYHQLSHHENRQDFSCTLCQRKFAHKALLANHMFTHSSAKPFVCNEDNCSSSFKSRGSLYNHKKAVHNLNNNKVLTCEYCGRNFALKASLQAHLKIHRGEKPFNCMYCDKRFSHRGNLKEHVRTHTKERPYLCDNVACGKSFTTSSQLKNHKMRHLSNKQFVCVECGKSFSQRAGLVSHMKIHKGESLECSICDKQFMNLSALKRHQRVHSGEKPFHCDVCNKAFSDPSNYRKHRQTHPSVKKFEANKSAPSKINIDSMENDLSDETHQEAEKGPSFALLASTDSTGIADDISTVSTTLEIDHDSPTNGHQQADEAPVTETFVQILTPEELATLNASSTLSDGNIIFLYQPDDLFSVSVKENEINNLDVGNEETVELQEEVVEMEELGSLNTIPVEFSDESKEAKKLD